MDLAELRAFITVVEKGSFLGAASALGVSRTTLRRHVASLEARAGVPLLETERHGVSPTEAGQVLVRQGRTMMEEASALLASIREVGQAPSGTMRVVLPVGLPPHLVTPIHAALRAAYPQLHYHVRLSNDPLSESLAEVDIAVHLGADPPRGSWISYEVLRVRQHLIASKGYLAKRGAPKRIDDLRRHELMAWQAPGEDARIWRTWKGLSFGVEPAIVATDIHYLRQCAIAGLGIAYVPDALVPDPGPLPDTLVPVMSEEVGQERPFRVSVPSALAEIPKVRMVIERVKAFLGEI